MTAATDRAVKRLLRGVTAGLLLLLVAGAVEAARWYEHYQRAEEALAAGDWTLAVTEANLALERRSVSGLRVRSYGMNVVDYFPYLQLGIGYYQLEQFDAALAAFETERQLAVVLQSPAGTELLERYRGLARAGKQSATDAALERTRAIVRESVQQAVDYRAAGRLEEAMAALARGLAVAPDDAEAVSLMETLRAAATEAERRSRATVEAARLVSAGQEALIADDAESAAGLFSQALGLAASEGTERLLVAAREAITATAELDTRRRQVTEAEDQARELRDAGQPAEALARVEFALALDPGETRLLELRRELRQASQQALDDVLLEETLSRASSLLAAGDLGPAVSAANRALALDRGNSRALRFVQQAYAAISRGLTVVSGGSNVPPAIRLADFREPLAGGLLAESSRRAGFQLTGVVIDATPVVVEFFDGAGRLLAGEVTSQAVGDSVVTEFRLRTELDTGLSTLEVVATDGGGLSSRSAYQVLYAPVWFRAPWILPAVLALVILIGGSLLLLRARRRAGRLRRRFNPYIAGRPVFGGELFFGRQQLLQKILQTVHNNSILLHGERRIGKTSLLHHLERRLRALDDPAYRFYPVLIDLQGVPEDELFATLGNRVAEELVPEATAVTQSRPAQSRSALPQPAMPPPLAAGERYDHHRLGAVLRALIATLQAGAARRVRIVLLIDEIDELNDYDPRINQRLRSLFMRAFSESLAAVVAGVRISRSWEKETSPWYNFFEEIELRALSRDEARELIAAPIRGTFEIQPEAVERILEWSECKPYPIQRLCLALVSRLHDASRTAITVADVEALTNGALS